jgi:L-alanine-DL-glutamate epimerase-like enolase superfamily enzyme
MQALDRITVYRLQVPLKVPYRVVFGAVEHFDAIIAEVIDRDGRTGFGEATVLTGCTDETIEDRWQAAKAFAGVSLQPVIGQGG